MIGLNESLINEVVRRLGSTGTLNTFIDTVNAGVADGVTIEYPQRVLDHVPPVRELVVFPTIGVSDGPSVFTDDTGWEAKGSHTITVVSFIEDLDQSNLVKKLRRTTRAVVASVMQGRNLPPDGWGTVLIRIDPGPTLGRSTNPQAKMSWTAVTLQAFRDETT